MLASELSAALDRRAGAFYAAAQFTTDADARRSAELLLDARTVGERYGLSALEGYVAALERLGERAADRAARRAIREAIDEAVAVTARAAWTGAGRPHGVLHA